MGKVSKIEITFPIPVDLKGADQAIYQIVQQICDGNQPKGTVMWPAGVGCKITYMPMTAEEEKYRGIEFDEDIFVINCTIRDEIDEEKGSDEDQSIGKFDRN